MHITTVEWPRPISNTSSMPPLSSYGSDRGKSIILWLHRLHKVPIALDVGRQSHCIQQPCNRSITTSMCIKLGNRQQAQ